MFNGVCGVVSSEWQSTFVSLTFCCKCSIYGANKWKIIVSTSPDILRLFQRHNRETLLMHLICLFHRINKTTLTLGTSIKDLWIVRTFHYICVAVILWSTPPVVCGCFLFDVLFDTVNSSVVAVVLFKQAILCVHEWNQLPFDGLEMLVLWKHETPFTQRHWQLSSIDNWFRVLFKLVYDTNEVKDFSLLLGDIIHKRMP